MTWPFQRFQTKPRALFAAFALIAAAAAALPAYARPSPSERPCPRTDVLFNHLPTDLGQVAGIVPLGAMNPAGHTIPTRHIYVYPNMTTPGDVSTAVTVPVYSPGRAEIVAVEYRPASSDWSIHLKPCRDLLLYYFHIDTLAPAIAAAVGDVAAGGVNLGDFTAKPVSIPLTPGQLIGHAQTFDIGVHDFRKPPQPFANPARYAVDVPALLAAFPQYANDPIALAVLPHIVPQAFYNRCPIDYFTPPLRAVLTARLSDHDGAALASGTPKCHSHMQDVTGTAQGNWNVTPSVQLFSLNENVPGFSHTLLEAGASPEDVNTTFEFPVRPGPQLTNRRFAEITDDAIYCYDLVRAHRGGPRLNAVILLQVSDGPGGPRSRLTIEFVRASRCPALPTPWRFGRRAATYYR